MRFRLILSESTRNLNHMKHLPALLSLTAFGLSHALVAWSQADCPSPYGEPDSNGYSTINAAYFDTDGSGTVDVPDLMNLLSAYGVVVAQASLVATL